MCVFFCVFIIVIFYLFVLFLFFFCFFFSSRSRHTRCALVTGVQTCALPYLSAQLDGWDAWVERHLRNPAALLLRIPFFGRSARWSDVIPSVVRPGICISPSDHFSLLRHSRAGDGDESLHRTHTQIAGWSRLGGSARGREDRKSTRLNSSH